MDKFLKDLATKILGIGSPVGVKKAQAQYISPLPDVQPTATPMPQRAIPSEAQITQGLKAFNPQTPLATQSGVLHNAMSMLSSQPKVDPYLAILVALRETRGGLDLLSPNRKDKGVNNVYNTMYNDQLINYPDFKTAVVGGNNPLEGGQSKGFTNMVLSSPQYETYRKTGNIDDFNNTYSPPGYGNPSLEQQRADLEKLRQYFK